MIGALITARMSQIPSLIRLDCRRTHTATIEERTLLQITPGERAALQLLVKGKGRLELAASLEVSEVEVDARLRGLFSRMGVRTVREAVAECERRGLLSADLSRASTPLVAS